MQDLSFTQEVKAILRVFRIVDCFGTLKAHVALYFNEKFISMRIDIGKEEGPVLAKKSQSIDGYPSMLFFNANGYLVKTILGSRSVEELLQEARLVAN